MSSQADAAGPGQRRADAGPTVVAGAHDAGLTTVIGTFGPRGDAPSISPVKEPS